jgi:tyrosyl-tRNA synthetase
LTTKLLTDPTGAKMGKTTGNTVNLTDAPEDIFGKIMALPDSLLTLGFELLTDMGLPKSEPMDAKKILAAEIVKQINGEPAAKKAREHFEQTFQKKAPEYTQTIKLQDSLIKTIAQITGSNSEAKRLIAQGAVDINGVKADDASAVITAGDKLKIGQKTFVKVI